MSSGRSIVLAVLLSLSVVAAGCIGGDEGGDEVVPPVAAVPNEWWVGAIPNLLIDPAHDHSDRSMHANLSTPNFEILGWDPLETETFGTTLTGMGCGGAATREDGRRLAIVHSIATTVSFVVADVTDPAQPTMLGEFYLPNAVVWDADISADGNHVLIGAYPPGPVFGRDVTPPVALPIGDADAPDWAKGRNALALFRNACTGEVVEVGPQNYLPGPAIVMAGIQDPVNPVFEDYVPQPVIGPHSVGSQMIDGVVYATSSVTNLAHEGSYYTFFEITDTPAGSKLVPLSVLQTPGPATVTHSDLANGSPWLNGHTDVYLHKHPVTGQLLAYLANWDGMYVYDLSVPQAPLPVSSWLDGLAGSVHTTYPFPTTWDGKQYLAVGQEVGPQEDKPTGWVYILDVTDPTNPTEVSRWTLPVMIQWGDVDNPDAGGLTFSPHYVAVLNETLFVSNYHGGLWAIDIADIANPHAVGIFVPPNDAPNAYGNGAYGPTVEDVVADQETGLLTTWDNSGGVYQLRFHAGVPTFKAPAWGAEPGHEH